MESIAILKGFQKLNETWKKKSELPYGWYAEVQLSLQKSIPLKT